MLLDDGISGGEAHPPFADEGLHILPGGWGAWNNFPSSSSASSSTALASSVLLIRGEIVCRTLACNGCLVDTTARETAITGSAVYDLSVCDCSGGTEIEFKEGGAPRCRTVSTGGHDAVNAPAKEIKKISSQEKEFWKRKKSTFYGSTNWSVLNYHFLRLRTCEIWIDICRVIQKCSRLKIWLNGLVNAKKFQSANHTSKISMRFKLSHHVMICSKQRLLFMTIQYLDPDFFWVFSNNQWIHLMFDSESISKGNLWKDEGPWSNKREAVVIFGIVGLAVTGLLFSFDWTSTFKPEDFPWCKLSESSGLQGPALGETGDTGLTTLRPDAACAPSMLPTNLLISSGLLLLFEVWLGPRCPAVAGLLCLAAILDITGQPKIG